MCPSYMATREEKHSTRGPRAAAVRDGSGMQDPAQRGDAPVSDGWRSEAVREALDLCLACKGCRTRLPGARGHGHLQGRVHVPPLPGPAAPAGGLRDGADLLVEPGRRRTCPARQRPDVGAGRGAGWRRSSAGSRRRGAFRGSRRSRSIAASGAGRRPRAAPRSAARKPRRADGGAVPRHLQQLSAPGHPEGGRRRAHGRGLPGHRPRPGVVLRPPALRLGHAGRRTAAAAPR